MDKKIIVANWKMNPTTLAEAQELFDFVSSFDSKHQIIICPPFIYLSELLKISSSVKLGAYPHTITGENLKMKPRDNRPFGVGAQNCHWEDKGAFTGEVSPLMLKNMGVDYVIIGHSERRWILNETDEMINKKIKAVLRNKMIPILAIGEREKSDDRKQVLTDQLSRDLDDINANEIENMIIAYEPVWAIGTGDAEIPEHTFEAVKIIKQFLFENLKLKIENFSVLYGGSVDSKNAADFLKQDGIDGLLVGGASINKEEFGKITELI